MLLLILIVAMLLGVLGPKLFAPSQWEHRFKVGLGLDLSSGTQVTLRAQTLTGKAPSTEEMNAAVGVIESRVNGTGNSGAQVQPQGANLLVVTVPGKGSQQTIELVSSTALLMFRQVLLYEPYGATNTPVPAASASPSATPSASGSPSATATPSASSTSTAKTSAKILPAASASASPSASAGGTASPSGSATASPSASASASPSASPSSSATSSVAGDPSLVHKDVLAKFNKLICKPGDTQAWKAQVGYVTTTPYNNPDVQVVACGSVGQGQWGKFALDVAKVRGTQVTAASAGLSTTSNQWQVNLTLNGQGAAAFSTLTSRLYNNYYAAGQSGDQNAAALNQVAIALDGNVVSSPQIIGAIAGGNAQITGSFTQAEATQLQNELKFGSVPLDLKTLFVSSVSAQVGRNQLDAGLIAAAIGLFLVVVYSFFYYRGLGLVSVCSLLIAGTITYLAVVLLSLYQNFTLELAGIAGLIVAIGITADSFVIYFERLRDEVREGKQLRPAVESGWKRARRTILVSDTVSFLAALLLYYFAIGEVKGFAYTLGLTTLIDVVVVFGFTKPMVTLLARTKFFGNGHPMSGLDPARLGAKTPWRSSVRRNQVRRRSDPASPSTASRNPGGS
ncbi:MAG TPA: protein translocase subunit SecD [Streptosporangiaceae bacterium]|nr:protein translocase subunit SecD [Streptosporangiaceae bacterium]